MRNSTGQTIFSLKKLYWPMRSLFFTNSLWVSQAMDPLK